MGTGGRAEGYSGNRRMRSEGSRRVQKVEGESGGEEKEWDESEEAEWSKGTQRGTEGRKKKGEKSYGDRRREGREGVGSG